MTESAVPLVSMIIPVFNGEAYVAESVESVLGQDYPSLELIAVDDGSTDNTMNILARYSDRLTIIRQRHRGPAAARNAGLDASRGEYVAFLDADDLRLPGSLRCQVDYLESHPEAGAAYGKWQIWQCDTEELAPPPEPKDGDELAEPSGWIYHRLLLDNYVSTIVVVIRRRIVEEVGRFSETLAIGEDYDYWIRMSRICEIHRLDRYLAVYRHHSGNTTKRIWDRNYEQMVVGMALRRWGPASPDGTRSEPGVLRRRLANLHYRFGYEHYHAGRATTAAVAFAKALRYRPTSLGCWRMLLLSGVRGLGRRTWSRAPA